MSEVNNRIDIRYSCWGALRAGAGGHPQVVMEKLGIQYKRAEPDSLRDCWYFIGCTNIPDELPEYLYTGEYTGRPEDD